MLFYLLRCEALIQLIQLQLKKITQLQWICQQIVSLWGLHKEMEGVAFWQTKRLTCMKFV